jgi:hypothetical protein
VLTVGKVPDPQPIVVLAFRAVSIHARFTVEALKMIFKGGICQANLGDFHE